MDLEINQTKPPPSG